MNSFLSGKKNLAVPSLQRAGGGIPRVSAAPGAAPHSHSSSNGASSAHANVEIVKEGDKVIRLVVTCVCGERTEIECLYPAGS